MPNDDGPAFNHPPDAERDLPPQGFRTASSTFPIGMTTISLASNPRSAKVRATNPSYCRTGGVNGDSALAAPLRVSGRPKA
jgi:hypothetical protein